MVFFNWATMQMAAKIVYYGPGLCGKTSNLSYIYAKTAPDSRGEMVSLETESDRTLFFDLLPIEVGTIGGFKTRLQLYTVPGQVFYNTTRKLVLKGVDGLVFVADSQRPMREANMESFATLKENLKEFGLSLSDLPIVLQYNKRDLSNILSIDELNADLNPHAEFHFCEASAVNGEGVITTLKEISKLTLKKLRARMNASDANTEGGVRVSSPKVQGVKPPQPASTISARSLARAGEEGVSEQHSSDRGKAGGKTPKGVATAKDATASPADEASAPPAETAPAQVEGPEVGWSQPDQDPSRLVEDPVVSVDEDEPMKVGFENGSTGEIGAPPPVKRVHVSNQIDILAELDGLRKQATMRSRDRDFSSSSPDLDLDSLLSAAAPLSKEMRKKLERSVNSDIFKNMRGVQFAIRIQGKDGETIHTFDPVSLDVDDSTGLKRLCLHLSLDLENLR
jgi:signal recognition particle receptor subunit beta